ncbi:MAG: hypothetical protein QY332_12060 [Anaerolineales bacterium]|nr:MAG: hypothetical protein QY332_12060 [Anaerolineales bacterium]
MSIQPAGKTYFGLAAILTGILAVLFILANIGSSYLRISPLLFNQLNTITALLYCILTPLTVALGFMGIILKRDSMILGVLAIGMVAVPFLLLFTQFAAGFIE